MQNKPWKERSTMEDQLEMIKKRLDTRSYKPLGKAVRN